MVKGEKVGTDKVRGVSLEGGIPFCILKTKWSFGAINSRFMR